tara:strand:- start:142 stop:792 length:651 start_codon:yes stop_codon:yes gene_type:complete
MSGKLQNIKAVKQMLAGTHKSQNKTQIGYEGKKTIAEEDVLERFEDGKPKVWIELDKGTRYRVEQHNGFRSKKPANSIREQVNEILTAPKQCPCCGSDMKGVDEERLNIKFWFTHKKCFSCVLKEETKVRAQGKEAWEEYCRKRMLANAEGWLKDADREVDILRESIKLQFVQDADGGVENWDQTQFFEKFDKDYKKFKNTLLDNLGNENGKQKSK